MGDDGKAQNVIRTIQRRGLQLVVPVHQSVAQSPTNSSPTPSAAGRLRYLQGRSGARLSYLVEGEGTPVLRIDAPGWSLEGEQSSPIWQKTAQALSTHHRHLRYSRLYPKDRNKLQTDIDFDDMAEDVATVADAAGFDRFAILTESGGVHAALRFAARYPDRVTRMVIQGGYVQGRSRRSGTDTNDDIIRQIIDKGWHAEAEDIGAAFMLPYLPEGPLEAIMDAARVFREATLRETELAVRDATNQIDNSPYLPKVTCPVLVIHGRKDSVHPVEQAQLMAEGLPNAELWILETANSIPVAGHPLWDQYLQGVLEFLAQDG